MPANILTTFGLLKLIEADLRSWVPTQGGDLSVSKDQAHVFELLKLQPGQFRCILGHSGQDPAGNHPDRTTAFTEKIEVIVSHNRGLPLLHGQHIAWDSDQAPLVEHATEVRDRLLSYRLPLTADDDQLQYLGMQTITVNDQPLDAYLLSFSIDLLMPAPTPVTLSIPS